MFRYLALLALLPSTALAAGPTPAFPGAEGAGALARGGRGGAVVKVTNLNDAGPGSLRAAIEAKGPRTVVFEVSGTIALKKALKITGSMITIAGQTAPGDGITLRGYPLEIAADDVVVRYLRSRLGDETGAQNDAVSVNSGRRIILDHLSASWSVDETLSVSANYSAPGGGPYDVTVQWCLIGESLNRSLHDKGAHGYGSLVRGGKGSQFSFHHNLWASHSARMPRPGNYTDAKDDPLGAFFDFRNNVFYNWGGESSGYNADNGSLAAYNFIGNAYIPGPNSTKKLAFKESNPVGRGYFDANAMDGVVPADPWSLVTGHTGSANRLAVPVSIPAGPTQSWAAAMAAVLDKVGASKARDPVDQRILAGVRARTHAIINSEKEVGGWPALKSAPAPSDQDDDGMSDAWERSHGLNPANASDGKADRDGDGYTNLEDYLNSLVS
jgi:hypothetical protein